MKLHSAFAAVLGTTVVLTACSTSTLPSAPATAPAASSALSAASTPSAATGSAAPSPVGSTEASVPSAGPTLGATLGPAPTSSPAATALMAPFPTGAPSSTLLTTSNGSLLVLGTGNAFHADGWKVQDAQAAGAAGKSPAVSSVVNCDSAGSVLEYRFSTSTGAVDIEAAQDILSASATNTLSIALIADGKSVAEKNIGFKERAVLQAPLAGVTVLQVVVKPTGTCTASSTVLITKAIATG